MADAPHFAFPFERAGGKVRVVEQSTAEHVMTQENVVIRCPLGFRQERPEYGWPWPEFHNAPLDTDALEAALRRWVPDSTVSAREYADVASAAIRHIDVEVETTTSEE